MTNSNEFYHGEDWEATNGGSGSGGRHSPSNMSMRQSKDINRNSPGWGVHSALKRNLETQGTQITQDVIKRPFAIGSGDKKIEDIDLDMVLDNTNSRITLH